MLALGAKGVMLGRAYAYALAAGGERGVSRLLTLMQQEMRAAMVLTGVRSPAEIDRSVLA
jgi:L-lactate dehydrogenase (cytochrome)